MSWRAPAAAIGSRARGPARAPGYISRPRGWRRHGGYRIFTLALMPALRSSKRGRRWGVAGQTGPAFAIPTAGRGADRVAAFLKISMRVLPHESDLLERVRTHLPSSSAEPGGSRRGAQTSRSGRRAIRRGKDDDDLQDSFVPPGCRGGGCRLRLPTRCAGHEPIDAVLGPHWDTTNRNGDPRSTGR